MTRRPGTTPKPTEFTTRVRGDKVTCSCGYSNQHHFLSQTKYQDRDDHAASHRK